MVDKDFSFWVKPHEDSKLSSIIDSLAETHNTLPFPPHVTLLAGIRGPQDQVHQAAEELSSLFSSIQYNFAGLSTGTFYFQCVFLRVEETPDVMKVHETAKSILSKYEDITVNCPNPTYMPHASLMYANMSDEEKTEIAAKLSASIDDFKSLGFQASSFVLYETDPDDYSMSSWKHVAEYSFKS